jgi:hypothetical protein
MSRIAVSGAGIALAAAITLKADDKADKAGEGRFRLGAGVSAVVPAAGGLKGGLGLGPVFAAEMKLTDRQSLRGKLGYVHYGGMDVDLGTGERRQNLSSLRLDAEWVYSFDSGGRGPYVFGGAGAVSDAWKTVRLGPSGDSHSGRHDSFHSLLLVGGGYAFRWFAVEHTRLFDFAGRPAGDAWEIRPMRGQR